MRGIMRTCVDAARLGAVSAEVAGCGLLLGDGCFFRRYFWQCQAARRRIHGHLERMHADIAVRAVLRAQPAANAPILDDDFERITTADRTYRTPDHAQRIAALTARSRNQ